MAQFTLDGVTYSRFRDIPGAVYTRSGVEYQQNAAGVLVPFDDDVPPISDGVGLGVYEARTNSIRNPTGLGAVPGAPGTFPTNWIASDGYSISGVGSEFGLAYVDIRYQGNATAADIRFETSTSAAASDGQVWTSQIAARIVGGSSANVVAYYARANRKQSDGATSAGGSVSLAMLNLSANYGEYRGSATLSASTSLAYIQPFFRVSGDGVSAIDVTIRFYYANLKLGANINDPPILQTNNAAATRGAPSMYINAPGLLVPPYTVVAWANLSAIDGVGRVLVAASDGTNTNRVQLERNSGNSAIMQVNGGTGGSGPAVTGKGGARLLKMAARVSATEYALSVDGAAPAKATGITPPPGLSQIRFGATPAGAGFLNSPLQRFQIINRDVTDAELRALAA